MGRGGLSASDKDEKFVRASITTISPYFPWHGRPDILNAEFKQPNTKDTSWRARKEHGHYWDPIPVKVLAEMVKRTRVTRLRTSVKQWHGATHLQNHLVPMISARSITPRCGKDA